MIKEINKAFKFRIYPDDKQKEIIQKGIDVDRFIYNHMLRCELDTIQILKNSGFTNKDDLNACRKKYKMYFNAFESSNYLTKLSKFEQFYYLTEVHATIRTYTLRKLAFAFSMMKKLALDILILKNIMKINHIQFKQMK
jgi:transposase